MKNTSIVLTIMLILVAGLTAIAQMRPDQQPVPDTKGVFKIGMAGFYVSPDGNDLANSGTTEDSPVASIAKAIERAERFIQLRGYPVGGITIHVANGVYVFEDGITISSGFSGTKKCPITIKAQTGANPRIVGGPEFSLSDFTEVGDSAMREKLHPDAAGKVLMLDLRQKGITEYGQLPLYGHSMGFLEQKTNYSRGQRAPELFFNAQPMTLARWPNEAFANVGSIVEQGDIVRDWQDDRKGEERYVSIEKRNDPPFGFAFRFDDKERLARWESAEDIRLYGYWYNNWADQAVQVANIDADAGVIRSVQPSAYGIRKGQRFYVYNVLEELDQPGEWYLDRQQGVLYIIPLENDPDATMYLSLLDEPFIAINGVSNLRIEGLEFGYARENGISIRNATHVTISDCVVANTGGTGIQIDNGVKNRISSCEVFNNGTGGVRISGGVVKELKPGGNIVENNLIYNYARLERTYNPALRLNGVGNIARNNEIHTGDHVAILFGGNNHVIEYNHIYDVCRQTDDMAAIYAGRSWTSRGTVIRYNLMRDLIGYKSGSHRVSGIYLDDGISGITVEGNVFLNCAQGVFFNGGRDNTAVDNVFIDIENMMRSTSMQQAYTTWAAGGWLTLTQNIKAFPINEEPWRSAYPNLATMLEDEPELPKYTTIKNNLLYNTPMQLDKKGIHDAVVEFGTVENNKEISKLPGSYNQATGRFEFIPDSGVFTVMPNLRKIQTEKIGRIQ